MHKYRRFKTTMTNRANITEDYVKNFIVRSPVSKLNDLHPEAKREYNRIIQEPLPLTYKLQDISEKLSNLRYEISNPLGGTQHIPFSIIRTHTNNLPVYTEYKNNRNIKQTIIRHIQGDVEEFKNELSKIVSNSNVTHKTGKVVVKGLHEEKIKLWLRRLGF